MSTENCKNKLRYHVIDSILITFGCQDCTSIRYNNDVDISNRYCHIKRCEITPWRFYQYKIYHEQNKEN